MNRLRFPYLLVSVILLPACELLLGENRRIEKCQMDYDAEIGADVLRCREGNVRVEFFGVVEPPGELGELDVDCELTQLSDRVIADCPLSAGGSLIYIEASPGAQCTITMACDGQSEIACSRGEVFDWNGRYFCDVSVGDGYVCGITAAGYANCWGAGRGDSSLSAVSPPWEKYVQMDAGTMAVGALNVAREFVLWGATDWMPEFPSGTWDAIASATSVACGIRPQGHVECWGPGDLGIVTDVPPGTMRHVTLGTGTYGVGLTQDGSIVVWGAEPPFAFDLLGTYSDVSAGSRMLCARTESGLVSCNGSETSFAPEEVLTTISVGYHSACGLRPDGSARCWGMSEFGADTAPLGTYRILDSYREAVCAITTDHELVCWGAVDFREYPTGPRNPLLDPRE